MKFQSIIKSKLLQQDSLDGLSLRPLGHTLVVAFDPLSMAF